MLFNSPAFIFLFLPAFALLMFSVVLLKKQSAYLAAIVLASLFFYGAWFWPFLLLLIASMGLNYFLGGYIRNSRHGGLFFALGVIVNVGVIAYFKYRYFIAEILTGADHSMSAKSMMLPLGISFYTFQQITYLSDIHARRIERTGFLNYAAFVSFFPQLIAGPIVHFRELVPQLKLSRLRADGLSGRLGLAVLIFTCGLGKKVLLADSLGGFVDPIFSAAHSGALISASDAWMGGLSFFFQIYFDFSGYCDMAIGLAVALGIALPINFNSPYRATSVSEFWRRWHITLSRFLRDYIYIPLGGSRTGRTKTSRNLLVTMLIGGLWHGAGWNFLLWGGMHGFALVIHHFGHRWTLLRAQQNAIFRFVGWAFTMIFVLICWIPFRSGNLETSLRIWAAMLGFGSGVPIAATSSKWLGILGFSGLVSFCLPNLYRTIRYDVSKFDDSSVTVATCNQGSYLLEVILALLVGTILFFSIRSGLVQSDREFIYFDF